MAPRKKAETSKISKEGKTKTSVTKTEILVDRNGEILGEYSKSVYNNGELVSFDIDWDKLRDHMKKI